MKNNRIKFGKRPIVAIGILAFLLLYIDVPGQRIKDNVGGGIYGHDYDLYSINRDFSNTDCGIRLNSNDNGYLLWQRYDDLKFRISFGGVARSPRGIDNDLIELDRAGNLKVRGNISTLNGGDLNFASRLSLFRGLQSRDWLRVNGRKGLFFQSYGGGFYMTDNTWVRTYGGKGFYHDKGIMRTDGTFQVGNNGSRFVVNADSKVGIGTVAPEARLHIVDTPQGPRGSTLVLGSTSTTNLRLGYHSDYTWIQSHGEKPLHINELGNNTIINLQKGNVGIGTDAPSEKLQVIGNIRAQKGFFGKDMRVGGGLTVGSEARPGTLQVSGATLLRDSVEVGTHERNADLTINGRVRLKDLHLDPTGNWADHVFEKDYVLMPLSELKDYIRKNKHLPEVPSAEEVAENGVDMDAMQVTLLKKIEELTLYLLEMKASNNRLLKEVEELKIQQKTAVQD